MYKAVEVEWVFIRLHLVAATGTPGRQGGAQAGWGGRTAGAAELRVQTIFRPIV